MQAQSILGRSPQFHSQWRVDTHNHSSQIAWQLAALAAISFKLTG